MEELQWHLIGSDGQQYGPYQPDQLAAYARDGTITPETMVWTAGLEEWIPASQVEGLFPAETRPRVLVTGMIQAPWHPVGVQASQQSGMEAARPLDKGYDTVSWGLRLVYWGVLINFLGVAAETVMEKINDPPRDYAILTVAIVGGYLLEILGVSLCFPRPRDAKARTFLGFSIGWLVLPIVLLIVLPFVDSLAMAMVLALALVFALIFSNLLFMLFLVPYLKRLSARMGNRTLELSMSSFLRFLSVIIGLIVLAGVGIAIMVGRAAGGGGGVFIFGGLLVVYLLLLVFAVLYLVAFFKFLRALQGVRQAILGQRSLAKTGSQPSPGLVIR
jgi:hypothetical protein